MAPGWTHPSFTARDASGSDQLSREFVLRGGYVVTVEPDLGDLPAADVLVRDGKIAAIGAQIDCPDALEIDASGFIVAPGFVDSHRHLWESLLRNALPDGSLFDYFAVINGQYSPAYRPEDVYTGTLLGALGALDAGITTLFDWSHIQNSPEHTDAAIEALQASGLRAVFGYGAPSIQSGHAFPEDIRRIRKGPFASDDQLVTLAMAGVSPEHAPDEFVKYHWGVARDLGVRISIHAGIAGSGQPGQIERYGREGWLGSDLNYVHCATLSQTEWQMIADTGGSLSITVPVELQMGHGNPPIDEAIAAGVRPSLGADVETSTPSDMFTQMRSTFAWQRGAAFHKRHDGSQSDAPLLQARDVLEFATIDGARAHGLGHKVGSLTPGKQADIVLLQRRAINLGPVNDPVGAIVLSMDRGNVDSVIVNGRFVKRHGRLLGFDENALLSRAEQLRSDLIARMKSAPDHQ